MVSEEERKPEAAGVEERKPEVETLIEQNLRLVLKIANDFLGRGLAWDDLVAEGNVGLVTAARRYNPERGAKFSTYSAWWIKQAIRQAIAEQAGTVRVPMGTQINARKVRKSVRKLTLELNRTPTDEEVAADAGLPLVTIERLRDARQAEMTSLDSPLSEEEPDGVNFLDFVPDEMNPSPAEELVRVEDVEQLLQLLETLSERERQVIRLRFGLDGEPVRTLDEVGKMLDCTNERVRQIQNLALKKLQRKMLRAK